MCLPQAAGRRGPVLGHGQTWDSALMFVFFHSCSFLRVLPYGFPLIFSFFFVLQ